MKDLIPPANSPDLQTYKPTNLQTPAPLAPLLIAVMGPTASGKSGLAESIANLLDAQLINADAFQVYRGLDIGTAKPTERSRYNLLDLKDPDEPFGMGEFVRLAQSLLEQLFREGRHAVVVGGTGLYIRALFEEFADLAPSPDPGLRAELSALPLNVRVARLMEVAPTEAANIDLRNPARVQRALERALAPAVSTPTRLPPFRRLKFCMLPPVDELGARIEGRVRAMVENGWVDEVAQIRKRGYRTTDPGLRAIGYRPLWRYLDGEVKLEEALATTIVETKRYAKRQRTWLRSEPSLIELNWRDPWADSCLALNLTGG